MDRHNVFSSNLRSVGYDELTNTLEIKFNNGNVYCYNVPKSTYINLMNASSKGSYFSTHIKHLPFVKKVNGFKNFF